MKANSEIAAFVLAIVLASLVAGVTLTILFFELPMGNDGKAREMIEAILVGGFLVLPVVAFVMSVVGIPIVLALRQAHLANLPTLLASGLLSGGFVCYAVPSLFGYEHQVIVVAGALAGFAAGLMWWLLAERRRSANA